MFLENRFLKPILEKTSWKLVELNQLRNVVAFNIALADVHINEMLSGLELSPDRLLDIFGSSLLHLLCSWQQDWWCQSCRSLIATSTKCSGVDAQFGGATHWLHSQCRWQDGWLIPDFFDHFFYRFAWKLIVFSKM